VAKGALAILLTDRYVTLSPKRKVMRVKILIAFFKILAECGTKYPK